EQIVDAVAIEVARAAHRATRELAWLVHVIDAADQEPGRTVPAILRGKIPDVELCGKIPDSGRITAKHNEARPVSDARSKEVVCVVIPHDHVVDSIPIDVACVRNGNPEATIAHALLAFEHETLASVSSVCAQEIL